MKYIYLGIGGLSGTFARYFLSTTVYKFFGSRFPHGTMVVNLIGCFCIGIFSALSEEKAILGPNGRFLLMIGFCGAFTTFSTFVLETFNLVKDGEILLAFGNICLSVLIGLLVFKLGFMLGEVL